MAFIPYASYSRDYNSFNFNEVYGFEEYTVYDMLQDSSGYFWFGTNTGLYSFDGNHFKNYTFDQYDTEYTNLKTDSVGNLWFTNFSGQLFTIQDDSIRVMIKNENDPAFISNYFFRHDSTLIVNNNNFSQLNLYDLKTKKQSPLFGAQKMITTTESESNKIYFIEVFNINPKNSARNVSLFELDKKTLRVKLVKNTIFESGYSFSLNENNGMLLMSFYDDNHWIYNFSTEQIIYKKPLAKSRINSFQSLSDNLLITTKNNYTLVHPITGHSQVHMEGLNVSTVYKDAQNNIWVATLGDGIRIISNTEIQSFKAEEDRIINYFLDDKNRLHTITSSGIFRTYLPPYNNPVAGISELEPYGIYVNSYSNKVHNLGFSNTANFDYGNLSFNEKSAGRSFKNAVSLTANISLVNFYSSASLVRTGIPDTAFGMGKNVLKPLRKNRTEKVFKGPNGKGFYVSYSNGLYYYNRTCKEFPVRINEKQSLLALSGYSDSSGLFWVGSKDRKVHGLYSDSIVYSYDVAENIISITRSDEFIFAASKNNIYKINLQENKVEVIGEDNGLLSEDILGILYHNDSILVISNYHLQKFSTKINSEIQQAPVITNVQLRVFGKEFDSKNGSYTLEPEENNISIEFTGYSLASKNNFTFEYRIKGNNRKWISTPSTNNTAQFPEFASGNYQFELRACNTDGLCSPTELIEFEIEKPFYLKAGFIGFALLVLAGTLLAGGRTYLKNSTKKERQKSAQRLMEKEVYQAQLAALRSQMNPHFMFNALNTIQEFIITNQQEIASEYLADFADLMRKYLDQSRKETVSLNDELETLQLYLRLENLRFDGNLDYTVELNPEIDQSLFEIPVMLIQPFVENSIKHGLLHKQGSKKLSISIELRNNDLEIIIEDNGIGRQQSYEFTKAINKNHRSFATTATDQRIALLNNNFNKRIAYQILDLNSNGKPSGTRVQIRIESKE
jgi:ligand-binding sensor domain-containing protein